MRKFPWHVVVVWPEGSGVTDPVHRTFQLAEIEDYVDKLSEIALSEPASKIPPLYEPGVRYEASDESDAEWRDVGLGRPQLDCMDQDVVEVVLRADVVGARGICRRYQLLGLGDPEVSDARVVARLTECVMRSFEGSPLLLDYHQLACRVLPGLIGSMVPGGES
jgi:hypothetical protein